MKTLKSSPYLKPFNQASFIARAKPLLIKKSVQEILESSFVQKLISSEFNERQK